MKRMSFPMSCVLPPANRKLLVWCRCRSLPTGIHSQPWRTLTLQSKSVRCEWLMAQLHHSYCHSCTYTVQTCSPSPQAYMHACIQEFITNILNQHIEIVISSPVFTWQCHMEVVKFLTLEIVTQLQQVEMLTMTLNLAVNNFRHSSILHLWSAL